MRRHQPALLGGVFTGVLSSLPIVAGANLCCCLWVVTGGLISTYLIQQNQETPVEASDGAFAGLLSGFVGALICVVASFVLAPYSNARIEDMQAMLDRSSQMTPEMRALITRLSTGRAFVLIGAAVILPLFSVFGMLGGLLGVTLFKKKPAPPTTLAS